MQRYGRGFSREQRRLMDSEIAAIAGFIAARLAETEAAANAGARRVGMPWRAERQPGTPGGLVLDDLGLVGSTGGACAAAHIALHDPASVLRDVAAKRRILARHHDDDAGRCAGCQMIVPDICPEKRDLAATWDTHPDYRSGWKP